jgi:hypothetical protein
MSCVDNRWPARVLHGESSCVIWREWAALLEWRWQSQRDSTQTKLRVVELIRYVEQQDQLDQLAQIVRQVVTGGWQATPDPR